MPPNRTLAMMLTLPEPAPQVPHEPARQRHEAAGDVAPDHQLTRIDEERDRHERIDRHAGIRRCKTTTGGRSR